MREAAWLARREMRRTWRSYFVTVLVLAAYGFFAAMMTRGLPEEPGSTGVDIFFIISGALLGFNFAMKDGLQLGSDPFSKRLYLMRSLPISASQIVISRVLSMTPALALNSFAFFGMFYGFIEGTEISLFAQLGVAGHLWFVLMWVGYALLWSGANLYFEQGTDGRTYMRAQFAMFIPFIVILLVLEWVLEPGIVLTLVDLAGTYGVPAAVLFLLVGSGAFAAWTSATVRRVARRDLQT